MKHNIILAGTLIILITCMAAMTVSAGSLAGDVEAAFRSGSPGAISGRLPDNGKVFLSIPAAGVNAGSYSRKQALTTLRQMFRQCKTLSAKATGGPGQSVRVSWTFTRNGKNRTITVYVSENNGKISSIRGEK